MPNAKNGVPQQMDTRVLEKKTRNALDRLDELEKALPQIVSGVNNSLSQLNNQLQGMTEIMDVLIENVGQEKVTAALAANRQKRSEDQAAAEKKSVDEALLSGTLENATEISEKTIVVGREFDKDGVVRIPGRVQVQFSRVSPEFQEKLKGQKPGFSFEIPSTGGKFEVDEIYDVVPPVVPAPAPVAAAPVAAPEAPVAEVVPSTDKPN
jgi:hypothetical protein